jgi:aminoglycoside phosphotransferase (APT) family kinase protein
MGLATQRDTDALLAGFGRWFRSARAVEAVDVATVARPSAGHSSETLLLDVTWSDRGRQVREELVLRLPPPSGGTHRDYDLVVQSAAQRSAAAAGVPVAEPSVVETDSAWLGAPFMVMPRVEGHIVGESAAHDRWVRGLGEERQATLHGRFLETLAAIHRADPAPAVAGGVPVRDNGAELAGWAEYLEWSADGSPVAALVDALAWCRARRPPTEPAATLLWGDVRLGNVVFGDDLRPRAVLDWDMAGVGAPEHDVAWFVMLEETIETLSGRRTAGFPRPADVPGIYAALLGRPLLDFEWYCTFALFRSAAVLTRVGYLHEAAGEPPLAPIEDNPVLDLLRARVG